MMGIFYLFLFISDFGETVQSFFLLLLYLNSRTNSCSLKTSNTLYVFSVDQKQSYNSSVKIKCNKKKAIEISDDVFLKKQAKLSWASCKISMRSMSKTIKEDLLRDFQYCDLLLETASFPGPEISTGKF